MSVRKHFSIKKVIQTFITLLYFIHCLGCCIGQVNANATSIIITLIINLTFLLYLCPLFYNHHEYPILDYHVQILDLKILFTLKMFSGQRTKYQYASDFILHVVLISMTLLALLFANKLVKFFSIILFSTDMIKNNYLTKPCKKLSSVYLAIPAFA